MKKIVALVLTLVLALSLSAVAFAAPAENATSLGTKYGKPTTNTTATYTSVLKYSVEKAPTYNTAKKVTGNGNVAYYSFNEKDYVAVSSLGEADMVVYSDAAMKNVYLYLKEAVVSYCGIGAVTVDFGAKCGQIQYAAYDKTLTYYTADDVAGSLYVANATGDHALLVNGQIVRVNVADPTITTVPHAAIPTVDAKTGKITGYTCANCKAVAVEAPNYASIPAGIVPFIDNWYFPATPAAAEGVESPKTFDAGIAMYVGMSLMAVTGSAVVIGKKKEF